MLTTWFSTQIVPSVISVVAGAVFGAVVTGWDKLATKYLLIKLGPSIKTIYDIIDPLLDSSLKGWSGGDVEEAVGFVVGVVSDGKLSPEEVNKAVQLITEHWMPQIAAQKITDGLIGEKEMVIAGKIREAIESRTLDTPAFLQTVKELYLQ